MEIRRAAERGERDWAWYSSRPEFLYRSAKAMAPEGLPEDLDEAGRSVRHAGLPRRFVPTRRLGAGGFGTVYAAWDEVRGTTVAVKRLERMDAASIYRFKQEFRVLAGRAHPNLVKLHGLCNEGSTWCLSMDFIDGVRFDTWIHGDGSPPVSHASTVSTSPEYGTPHSGEASVSRPPIATVPLAPAPFDTEDSHERLASGGANHSRLRSVLAQLVDGVLALHDSGIIHRDLKPSNVLVSSSGHLTILDFGLAVVSDSRDAADKNGAGTPAYMSPEQARGVALTVASDWYSVGVMLYEALVGHPPFGGTVSDILAAKRTRDARDPRLEHPNLPEDLCELAMELLRREPTARPHGAAIARSVGLSPSVGPRRKHVLGGPFVGRVKELEKLQGAFEAARSGRTVVAHVQGQSGSGKTTVVRRFVSELAAREEDVVILEGRCFERESVPFKALDDLVDALGRHLSRLNPVEAAGLMPRDTHALVRIFPSLGRLDFMESVRGRSPTADPHELRRRAFAALREVLARIRDTQPVVLVLDDAQWGDRDSADLVRNLLAPPDMPHVLLVVAYRGDSANDNELLRTLRRPQAVDAAWDQVDVPLGPLELNEALELAETLLKETPAAEARPERIAEEGANNPLLIAELVRASSKVGGAPLEVSMLDVVRLRTARLDASTRLVLDLLASSERPLSEATLGLASALSSSEVAEALDSLRDEHLITITAERSAPRFEVFHDRVRQALLASMDQLALRECHAALASAHERGGADPETISHHKKSAGLFAEALVWAEKAGDRAMSAAAFEHAAALFHDALSLADKDVESQHRLWRKLAPAVAGAGRGAEAASLYIRIADTDPADRSELLRLAGEQFLRAGYTEEAIRTLGPLLDHHGLGLPESPSGALASLLFRRLRVKMRGYSFVETSPERLPTETLSAIDLCWALGGGLAGIDVVRSAHYYTNCLWLSLESGEPYRVARALAIDSVFSALEGTSGLRRAEHSLRQAEEIAKRIGHRHALGWALTARAVVAWTRGELEQCEELCDQAVAELREHAYSFREIGSLQVWFGLHASFLLGHVDRVAMRAPACAREAEARGDRYTLSTVRAYILPLLWATRDRPAEGRADAESALAVWPSGAWYHQHWANLRAHCFLDLYEGQAERIPSRVEPGRARMKQTMQLRLRTPRLELEYLSGRAQLEIALSSGARAAKAAVRRSASSLEGENATLATAYAQALRVGLLGLETPDAAPEAWKGLEAGFARAGMRLHESAARFRRGQLLAGEEGARLRRAAEERLSASGVANPEAFCRLLVPSAFGVR